VKALKIGAALLCAALATAGQAEDNPGPLAGGRYVAMGSSFAAGSGFGQIKYGSPQRCGRSFENYATLTAEALRMLLVDVSCGGATTAHVLGAWNELPPQIEAVTADTRLVTITIGGNDIGYVGYLIAESCKVRGPILLGAAGTVCPEVPAPGDAVYAKLENDLRAIANEVKRRAPNARLVFVQYLPMIPKRACADVPLSSGAARTAKAIGVRLFEVTAKVAKETGASSVGTVEVPGKRLPCGSDDRWVQGWPADYKTGETFPWHPTREGHAALAQELAELLGGK
jgi:lysophospholipase L1-like esterase